MIVCPQNTYLQKSWKAVRRPLCLGFCVLDYYQGIREVLVGDKRLPPWAGLVQHCSSSSGTHCWRDGPCTSKVSGKLPPWLQLGSSSFLQTPEDKENSTHKKRNQPRRAFPRRVLSLCTPAESTQVFFPEQQGAFRQLWGLFHLWTRKIYFL